MDNFDNDWRRQRNDNTPAPVNASTGKAAPEVPTCPTCGRKLLSTRSILCNWCGARINDPEYLEKAAAERAKLDAKVRAQVSEELAEDARFGVLGRLKRRAKTGVGSRIRVLDPHVD